MNLQTFIESQTESLKRFERYWNTNIVPNFEANDLKYWENDATMWDWVDQYEAFMEL